MGIQGLLPFLKKIHTPANISQFQGSTVAVDAYCWLHKGAFSCAEKLALGEKTDQYVYYCMKYIDYLQRMDLKVIMVFDGCHLESKAGVEKSRRERREINRKKAAQFLREGKRSEAKECLQRCIDISPQMALELMKACRARGVDCIVAPYEADAQLAYLSSTGIAQIIVTEDSDLLLFGCEKIMFKMDFHGNGTLIEKSRLNEVMGVQTDFYTFDKFRYMCILSGCDYLSSLTGIGLAKANKVFKLARQGDVRQLLKKLPTYLKMNIAVSNDYVEGFVKANNTFLYQLVFDPLTRSLKPLNPHPPELKEANLNYAGKFLPQDLAYQIALGNIDIHNKERIADFDPDKVNMHKGPVKARSRHLLSIWDKRYSPRLSSSGSPCKEIQTSEIKNRNNHSSSGVGKDRVINTQSLKKMLAKQNKGLDPALTPGDMASLYAAEDDGEQQMKRARKNLMQCSDGFSVLCDVLEDDVGTEETPEKESDGEDSSKEDENDSSSNCRNKRPYTDSDSFQYTAANIGEETFKRDSEDSRKENETSVKNHKHRNVFAVSKANDNKRPHTDSDSFKYTAANIGEETFKRDREDSRKEDETPVKNHKHRNIFAVSKSNDKRNAVNDSVEVKSWYFSSSKKPSSPVTKTSPVKILPSPKSASSPRLGVKSKKSGCNPSSIRLLFERADERNKEKIADANMCRAKDSTKEKASVSEEKLMDISADEDGIQSPHSVQNNTLPVMASSKTYNVAFSSGKKKQKPKTDKNLLLNKKNGEKSSLSKLSAFSWSKSISVQKMGKDRDSSVSSEKTPTSCSRQIDPSESSGEFHPSKPKPESSGEFHPSKPKRRISVELDDSVTNLSVKRMKTSPKTSNYSGENRARRDSVSRGSDSETDVQEMQHQSYEGFLKSLGNDTYTKLVEEPKKSEKYLDPVVSNWSKAVVEKSYPENCSVKPTSKSFSEESLGVIDLTENYQPNVKPTCRVSGLTKNRGKQKSLDTQQPKIQDFFSKYSFNRKKTPQIRSITREENRPTWNDNNEEDENFTICTPVTGDLPIPEAAYVKRKLSL